MIDHTHISYPIYSCLYTFYLHLIHFLVRLQKIWLAWKICFTLIFLLSLMCFFYIYFLYLLNMSITSNTFFKFGRHFGSLKKYAKGQMDRLSCLFTIYITGQTYRQSETPICLHYTFQDRLDWILQIIYYFNKVNCLLDYNR